MDTVQITSAMEMTVAVNDQPLGCLQGISLQRERAQSTRLTLRRFLSPDLSAIEDEVLKFSGASSLEAMEPRVTLRTPAPEGRGVYVLDVLYARYIGHGTEIVEGHGRLYLVTTITLELPGRPSFRLEPKETPAQ